MNNVISYILHQSEARLRAATVKFASTVLPRYRTLLAKFGTGSGQPVVRWGAATGLIFMLAIKGAMLIQSSGYYPVFGTKVLELRPESIGHVNDNRYVVGLRPAKLLRFADNVYTARRSRLIVKENGKPLGPPHSVHVHIAEKGEGRYSHWQSQLYFSSSDNSDPRTNGRNYRAEYSRLAPPFVILFVHSLILIFTIVLLSSTPINFRRFATFFQGTAIILLNYKVVCLILMLTHFAIVFVYGTSFVLAQDQNYVHMYNLFMQPERWTTDIDGSFGGNPYYFLFSIFFWLPILLHAITSIPLEWIQWLEQLVKVPLLFLLLGLALRSSGASDQKNGSIYYAVPLLILSFNNFQILDINLNSYRAILYGSYSATNYYLLFLLGLLFVYRGRWKCLAVVMFISPLAHASQAVAGGALLMLLACNHGVTRRGLLVMAGAAVCGFALELVIISSVTSVGDPLSKQTLWQIVSANGHFSFPILYPLAFQTHVYFLIVLFLAAFIGSGSKRLKIDLLLTFNFVCLSVAAFYLFYWLKLSTGLQLAVMRSSVFLIFVSLIGIGNRNREDSSNHAPSEWILGGRNATLIFTGVAIFVLWVLGEKWFGQVQSHIQTLISDIELIANVGLLLAVSLVVIWKLRYWPGEKMPPLSERLVVVIRDTAPILVVLGLLMYPDFQYDPALDGAVLLFLAWAVLVRIASGSGLIFRTLICAMLIGFAVYTPIKFASSQSKNQNGFVEMTDYIADHTDKRAVFLAWTGGMGNAPFRTNTRRSVIVPHITGRAIYAPYKKVLRDDISRYECALEAKITESDFLARNRQYYNAVVKMYQYPPTEEQLSCFQTSFKVDHLILRGGSKPKPRNSKVIFANQNFIVVKFD